MASDTIISEQEPIDSLGKLSKEGAEEIMYQLSRMRLTQELDEDEIERLLGIMECIIREKINERTNS